MNKKLMLVILLLLAFILNVSIVNAWWSVGGSWGYRKQVTITSSSALTNYQVRIPFASLGVSGLVSGGKMKSDYSDARFLASDDATALDYWVDAELSEFWVEVADVVNGSTLIYFYYGNPSATAGSNGDNTFQLYDNFTGTSLDTNKWQTWQVGTGTKDLQVGSDRLLVTARGTEWTCSGIYTKTAVSYTSLVIEVKNKWNLSTSSDTSKEVRITRDASLPTAQDTGNQYRFDYYKWNPTSHHYRILKDVTGTGSVVIQVDLTNNNPANYEWERYVCYNGNQKGYRSTDGATFNATWTATDTSHPLPNSLFIGYSVSEGRNSVASTAELDWIRVRKYNATEPSIGTVGSEEQGFGTSPTKLKLDSATSSSVVADGTSTSLITMGIYDNGDLVVSSASNSITFTISGQGTLVAPTAKNATSGKATIMFQSGTTTGAAVVSATSSNLAMATAGLTLTAGAPAKLVNTAQPISIVANASSTSVITARVTDANNNPVTTVSSGWSGGLTGANGGKWSYRKPVTIASSSVQSAYQVRVLFTDVGLSALVSAGKVQSDYDDIRFSTSSVPTSELNYWIDSDAFWVKTNLVNGSTTLYMYYGNSLATATSNGDSTFNFYADFEGCTVGDNGACENMSALSGTWQVVSGKYYESSNALNVVSRATGLSVSDYEAAVTAKMATGGSFSARLVFGVVDNSNYWMWMFDNTLLRLRRLNAGAEENKWSEAITLVAGQWYNLKVRVSGTTIECYLDGVLKRTETSASGLTGSIGTGSHATVSDFDKLRVGKYSSGTITVTGGTEETGTLSVSFVLSGPGTLQGSATCYAVNGASSIVLQSNGTPGNCTVTSTSSGYGQGTVVVNAYSPLPPSKVLCTAEPASIYNNGTATSLITARICDSSNNLVGTAANTVNFSVSGAGGTIATTQRVASGGIATVKLTATTTPGASTVTATTSGLTQGTVAVTTQQCKLLCTAQPTAIYNNGTSTSLITARVCDAADALIATAANTVNFSVSGGCGTIATTQMVASGGIATVKLTSTVTTGSATVTATSSGLTQGTVNVDVQSYKLLCTAQPASITNTGATTSLITARVCDLTDTLVTTATNTINFSVSGSAGTIATTQCNASGGIATVKLTSTVNYGTATVTATSSGIMQGTVSVMVTQVATKLLCTASPAAINADNVATSLITARVSDPGNALVSTATNTVLFTITGQGTLLGATSKIASGGMATVLIRSTLTIGTATVTATSTNLSSGTVAVKVTNLPPIAGLAVSSYGKFEITLTWTQGTYSRFRVDRSLNSGFTSSTTLCNWNSNITQPTYADTNLTANTIYYYKVYGYTTGETNISEPCTAVSQKTDDAENKIIASIFTDVVHGSDVKISIPAGTFSTDSYIEITPNPVNAAISNANAKIGEFIKPDSSEYEIGVYNLAGGNLWNAEEYNHDITLKMYYDKKYMTDHGIIEDTLKLFALDEEKQLWEKVDGEQNVFSTFNPPYVQVVLPHFSIYCLLGSGENMKVFNLINFPNPFSYETVFSFELTMDASKVVLGIYTISGRLVSKFEDTAGMSYGYNEMPIGTGSVVWDGTDVNGDPLANGVYIYKLTATPDSDIYGEGIYKPGNASGKLMIVR